MDECTEKQKELDSLINSIVKIKYEITNESFLDNYILKQIGDFRTLPDSSKRQTVLSNIKISTLSDILDELQIRAKKVQRDIFEEKGI